MCSITPVEKSEPVRHSSPLKLWLVRHGETEVNAGRWSPEPTLTHLTPKGRKQARQSAEHVKHQPNLFILSPLIRAQETGLYFTHKWPTTPKLTLPIYEFIYLSPKRLKRLTPEQRKQEIKQYWLNADPLYCDGDDSESFQAFLNRVEAFHTYIMKQSGYIVAIGHGQFFNAFQFGLEHDFNASPMRMCMFRQYEASHPIKNGETIRKHLHIEVRP